jgi:hypothetical protein
MAITQEQLRELTQLTRRVVDIYLAASKQILVILGDKQLAPGEALSQIEQLSMFPEAAIVEELRRLEKEELHYQLTYKKNRREAARMRRRRARRRQPAASSQQPGEGYDPIFKELGEKLYDLGDEDLEIKK